MLSSAIYKSQIDGSAEAYSPTAEEEKDWFALYTMPRAEPSIIRHLDVHRIESFLPTYESTHLWKNGQHAKITQPLFPSYLFIRISPSERVKILQAPGALKILGSRHGKNPSPMRDSEIEVLRAACSGQRIEPYRDLIVGKKVRVKCGPMQGAHGILVEKRGSLRFILSIEMINQNAAVEVSPEELENVVDEFSLPC